MYDFIESYTASLRIHPLKVIFMRDSKIKREVLP